MRTNFADRDAQPGFLYGTEATNTDVVLEVEPSEDQYWVIDWIGWSYSGDPPTGEILIEYVEVDDVTVDKFFSWDVRNGGPGILQFRDELYNASAQADAPKNQKVRITLKAAAGAVGKLTVRYT